MTEPNLRFSAKIFSFLRESVVFCSSLRPPNAWISRRRCESAKISGFLRKLHFGLSVSLCHLSSVPLSAPWFSCLIKEKGRLSSVFVPWRDRDFCLQVLALSFERGVGLLRRQIWMLILQVAFGCPNFLPPAIFGVILAVSKLGEARLRKVHFSGDFSGGFWFSQDRLFSRNSTRKPLNLIKSPIFTNTSCKSTSLYNAPSMHTVDDLFERLEKWALGSRQIRQRRGRMHRSPQKTGGLSPWSRTNKAEKKAYAQQCGLLEQLLRSSGGSEATSKKLPRNGFHLKIVTSRQLPLVFLLLRN